MNNKSWIINNDPTPFKFYEFRNLMFVSLQNKFSGRFQNYYYRHLHVLFWTDELINRHYFEQP